MIRLKNQENITDSHKAKQNDNDAQNVCVKYKDTETMNLLWQM